MKCTDCKEDVDEVTPVKVGRRTLKLCEDCLELSEEQDEIAGEAQSVIQGMMEYKGR
ncbi:MAG: hypothetical protein GY822_00545 [Deltaproteobacteria bacterium]|nr:hypothetical protein [Deltaproteobacteria bacterium]